MTGRRSGALRVAARTAQSVLIVGLMQWSSPAAVAVSPGSHAGSVQHIWHLNRNTFDRTADACTDFYQYVCGGWIASVQIPPDRVMADLGQDAADAGNDLAIRQLLTSKDHDPDPEVMRLRTFFASCSSAMPAAEAAAAATLRVWLARIDSAESPNQFMSVLQALHEQGINALFQYVGEPDPTDRTRNRASIQEGVLGLRRDAYLAKGGQAAGLKAAYRRHVARQLTLSGVSASEAERDATAIYGIEARLAPAALSFSARFDPKVSEHPMTETELQKVAPHIDWHAYLAAVGYRPGDPLNVVSPAYMRAVDQVFATTSVADLRAYLRWIFLDAMGPALPGALAEEYYRFAAWPLVLQRSRFDECKLETIKGMGVELSHQFSTRILGREARDEAKRVVRDVQLEAEDSTRSDAWLSPAARAASRKKVQALDLKVGYPDSWPPTGAFPLERDDFLANMLAAQAFQQQQSWDGVHAPRDPHAWEVMVYPNAAPGLAVARLVIPNGYPDVYTNSMILTAALLRPPVFDPEAPPEVQFGTFGTIVGHEIVHVLENHQFDWRGNDSDFWSAEDVKSHEGQSACLVNQTNDFVLFGDKHLDGRYTFDENVADLSGIPFAFTAMAREHGDGIWEKGNDGLSPAQRFFIAYAQRNCTVERPAYFRERAPLDGHAPSRFRVNDPLSNMPEFARAFSCRAGSPMARPRSSRCVIWAHGAERTN